MLDFIVNTKAGGKKGKKIKAALNTIEKRLKDENVEYTLHYTEYPKHATEIARALNRNGATDIIVLGGDGTLHETLNGIENFDKTALGLIPCGTGNDFANAVKIPEDVSAALDIILKCKPQYTDFMQMPTVRGINIIGMGIDVEVLKKYERAKKKTKLTYTLCLIKSLLSFNYSDFDVETDDGTAENYRSIIACVANGVSYGGGIPICPPASPCDKTLDFVAMKEIKKLKLIGAFMKLKKGKVLSLPQAVHFNLKKIKIIPKGDYTVQVDGQLYDNIPFEISIVSDTLKFYR